jgi:hypothetical protein
MKTKMRTTGSFVLVAVSTLMMACAKDLPELPVDAHSTNTYSVTAVPQQLTADPLEAVADDLVSGLSFISGMTPNVTSLRTPLRNTEFDALVKTSMLEQGYTFDEQLGRTGSEQLSTSFLQIDRDASSSELIGIISINSVFVKRTYLVTDSGIEPKTAYVIKGINPQRVRESDQVRVL